MKSLFLILALVAVTATSALAQVPGTYHFGDQEAPEVVLEPNHPGYAAFTQAVANHSQENTEQVNWLGVMADIAPIPSLENVTNWLGANHAAAYVYVYCCGGPGWACYARVPYSCSYACGC